MVEMNPGDCGRLAGRPEETSWKPPSSSLLSFSLLSQIFIQILLFKRRNDDLNVFICFSTVDGRLTLREDDEILLFFLPGGLWSDLEGNRRSCFINNSPRLVCPCRFNRTVNSLNYYQGTNVSIQPLFISSCFIFQFKVRAQLQFSSKMNLWSPSWNNSYPLSRYFHNLLSIWFKTFPIGW